MLNAIRAAIVMLVCVLAVAGVRAQPGKASAVAMITDLVGEASLVDEKRTASILDEILAGQRIRLDAGGRMVLVFLKSGEELDFRGPSLVQVREGRADVLSGEQPERRSTRYGSGKGIRISPVNINQGAVLMRSLQGQARLRLLSLVDTVTLDAWPEFRWNGADAGSLLRLEIYDDKGKRIFEREVGGDSFVLPGTVRLKSGVRYRWLLTGKAANGQSISNSAHFTLASLELRAEAENLRPGANATLSERVIYAAWLEQKELRDEARKYWRSAASERPNDSRLRELAGPF
ncbi:MAG: hypothetical protein LDL44_15155 [Caenispirillum sp.]|nr:hypothetical protein [Caenispirillum sp.]